MKYEIDMLGVGAADALLIRFFDDKDNAYVILVDSGNYSNGKTVADFCKKQVQDLHDRSCNMHAL